MKQYLFFFFSTLLCFSIACIQYLDKSSFVDLATGVLIFVPTLTFLFFERKNLFSRVGIEALEYASLVNLLLTALSLILSFCKGFTGPGDFNALGTAFRGMSFSLIYGLFGQLLLLVSSLFQIKEHSSEKWIRISTCFIAGIAFFVVPFSYLMLVIIFNKK